MFASNYTVTPFPPHACRPHYFHVMSPNNACHFKQIDYEKLAGEMGMTNPRSAANAWGAIKKKMAWTTAAQPATGGKSTGGKRKKAATTDDDGDDQATPTKKAKATPTKAPRKKATLRPKTPAVAKDSDSDNEGTAAGDEETKAEPEVKAEPEANNEDEDEGI